MRRTVLTALTVAGVAVPLVAGTAIATAKDSRSSAGFEIEIDPELDARFGPRPVNAVAAAAIVAERFPGARVVEAELDEEGGRPIWEIEYVLRGSGREVDVDAVDGQILTGDDEPDNANADDDDSGDDSGDDD
ncbi:MAG: PepSY domain-containing protein [Actinoplanes sp.]